MQITGKRIIITGAASGIGRATLAALAAYDARIIAVDIDEDGLDAACRDLDARPATITPYACDLAQPDNIDALLAFALQYRLLRDLFDKSVDGRFPVRRRDERNQFMFGRQHRVGHAEGGIGPRGEHAEIFPEGFNTKIHLRSRRPANPVALHVLHTGWPIQIFQTS